MAGIKIVDLPALGRNLSSTDLFELSLTGGTGSRKITGQEILNSARLGLQPNITLTTTGSSGSSTFAGDVLNVPTYTLSGLGGVPTTRTLTINGVAQDLSSNRSWTISTGLSIGTTPITSGVVGQILFEGAGNVVSESAGLTWSDTTKVFSIIGNQNATTDIIVSNTTNGASALSRLRLINNESREAQYFITPTAYSAYGALGGSTAGLYTNVSGGFAIFPDQFGPIRFITGSGSGNTEKARFVGNTGNFLINTTTDAGYRLDVNGTARVSGALTFNGGTGASNTISQGGTYGLLLYGGTGTNSDLTLTDRSGNLRFRIVNGGNILQTTTTINDIVVGGGTFTSKSIYTSGVYGLVLGGSAGSSFNFSLLESTGSNGLFIDSSGRTKIGAYNSTFSNSAILEAVSTTQGFLQPRMTTTQRDAIVTPATGLQIYNTTTNTNDTYNGTAWVSESNGNIYNIDGTLTANRTITNAGYSLSIRTGIVDEFTFTPNNASNPPIFKVFNSGFGGKLDLGYGYAQTGGGVLTIGTAGAQGIYFASNSIYRAYIFPTTGNLLLQSGGTFTDAGYKLDVNGTARVQDTLNITSSSSNGALNLSQTSVGFATIICNRVNTTNAISLLMFQDLKTGAGSRSFSMGIGRSGDPQWTNGDFIFAFYKGSGGWEQNAKIFNNSGNWAIENGTATNDIASAILQVNSTTKGFLPPRMTTTQKNAIASPTAGLVVYDTTLNKLCVYTTAWETITSV